MTQEIPVQRRDAPITVEATAGRPVFHTVCHDCIMEAVHTSLRAAAGEERAHLRAHPEHFVETAEVSGE